MDDLILKGGKQLLCHQCATVAATMYNLPPPPTTVKPQQRTCTAPRSIFCKVPGMLSTTCHARIDVDDSWSKTYILAGVTRVDGPLPQEAPRDALSSWAERGVGKAMAKMGLNPAANDNGGEEEEDDDEADALAAKRKKQEADDAEERKKCSPFCAACLGAYQFLDSFIVPYNVFRVRSSPYIDSKDISLGLGVPRTATFVWHAAAAKLSADFAANGEKPHPNHVVPPTFGNFKDFYCADLRARILAPLLVSYQEGQNAELDTMLQVFLRGVLGTDAKLSEHIRCKVALRYIEEGSGGMSAGAELTHHFSQETVYPRIPKSYTSNKCDIPIPYSVVYDVAPTDPTDEVFHTPCKVNVKVSHDNIFIIGNYCKYLRSVSQSPWFADGERIGSYSLQEIIADEVLPLFFPFGVPNTTLGVWQRKGECDVDGALPGGNEEVIAKRRVQATMGGMASPRQAEGLDVYGSRVYGWGSYKFHSAGREDVDVRMLGEGRPFVLEIIAPHREFVDMDGEMKEACRRVNESHDGIVEIVNEKMQYTDNDITVRLQKHSESKRKFYRCVCYSSRALKDDDEQLAKLKDIKDLELVQKTPLRVLHRRSLLARSRVIHSVTARRINDHWLEVDLETQAGTYVKEFVHGDQGRTYPNLGMLLSSVTDIIQLDVLGMVMEDVA